MKSWNHSENITTIIFLKLNLVLESFIHMPVEILNSAGYFYLRWKLEKAQYISHSGGKSSPQDLWTHIWPSTVIILKWLQQQLCIIGKFSHFECALYGITPSIASLAVQNLFRSLELFFFEKSIITLQAWKSSVGISKWQWTLTTELREDLRTINLKFNTIKISLAFRF